MNFRGVLFYAGFLFKLNQLPAFSEGILGRMFWHRLSFLRLTRIIGWQCSFGPLGDMDPKLY
jgi:hypothetical protein